MCVAGNPARKSVSAGLGLTRRMRSAKPSRERKTPVYNSYTRGTNQMFWVAQPIVQLCH
jgi:hypothetical protein